MNKSIYCIVPLDYAKAVKWYKKAAALKYPAAEVNLYTCYSGATGVERDIEEALLWLRRSAKHEVHDIADGRYDERIQKYQQGLTR